MTSSGLWFQMQDVKSRNNIRLTKIQKKIPVASRVVDPFYFVSLASIGWSVCLLVFDGSWL